MKECFLRKKHTLFIGNLSQNDEGIVVCDGSVGLLRLLTFPFETSTVIKNK